MQQDDRSRQGRERTVSDAKNALSETIRADMSISSTDIRALREARSTVQSFKMTPIDKDYVRDAAHALSNDVNRRIDQADIVAVSLLLFRKVSEGESDLLRELLEQVA